MKVKVKIIILLISIATFITSFNVYILIENKNKSINKLKLQNIRLNYQTKKYKTCLKLINKSQLIETSNEYVLFFPKSACSSCLEKIVLHLHNKQEPVLNNLIITIDDPQNMKLIEYLNDAYNLNINFQFHKLYLKDGFNNPVLLKFNNKIIVNAVEISMNDIDNLNTLLQSFFF